MSAINLYPSEGIWAVGEKANSAELITNSLSVLDYHCMGLHTSFSNLEYKCDCFSVKTMPFGDQFFRALVRSGGITWKCRLTVIRYFQKKKPPTNVSPLSNCTIFNVTRDNINKITNVYQGVWEL